MTALVRSIVEPQILRAIEDSGRSIPSGKGINMRSNVGILVWDSMKSAVDDFLRIPINLTKNELSDVI